MAAGQLGNRNDVLAFHVAEAGNVIRHSASEQLHILRQVANMLAEILRVPMVQFGAIEADRAIGLGPDPGQHPDKARFARRAGTDDAKRLARLMAKLIPLELACCHPGAGDQFSTARWPCGRGSTIRSSSLAATSSSFSIRALAPVH